MRNLQIAEWAYYQRRDGAFAGPMKPTGVKKLPWKCPQTNLAYTHEGIYEASPRVTVFDLTHRVKADGTPWAEPKPTQLRWLAGEYPCQLINQPFEVALAGMKRGEWWRRSSWEGRTAYTVRDGAIVNDKGKEKHPSVLATDWERAPDVGEPQDVWLKENFGMVCRKRTIDGGFIERQELIECGPEHPGARLFREVLS